MLMFLLACAEPPAEDQRFPADPIVGDLVGDDSGDTRNDDTGDTGEGDTAGSPDESPFTEDVVAALVKALKRDLSNDNAFAGQIAVWYRGEIVVNEAVGSRDPEGTEPIDTDTLFEIGSDTKKIAAIALLQQVERGRLSLDQTVAEALPGLDFATTPGWAAEATLHHLVSHQGGQYDYTPWDEAPADSELRDRAYGDYAARSFAWAPPGAMWNYANPNFSIAGLATETADGRAWADIVEQDIFGPLGMTRSFARKSEAVADGNIGASYGLYDYVNDPANVWADSAYRYGDIPAGGTLDNGFTRPAGLVWSNAEDQARLLGFFVEGDPDVLSDELRAAATTSQVPLYPNFPPQGYGYGWVVLDGVSDGEGGWTPLREWSHGGNTFGYTSYTKVFPDQELAVSILMNSYGASPSRTEAALYECCVTLPASTEWPVDLFTETDHDALAGTYVDPLLGRMLVSDDAGTLTLAFPDLTVQGWDADSDLEFWWSDEYAIARGNLKGYDISFIPDDDGVYRWARNRLFVGTRTDDPARPRPLRADVREPPFRTVLDGPRASLATLPSGAR